LAKTLIKAKIPYHTSGCGQGRGVFFRFLGPERIAKISSFLSVFRFKNLVAEDIISCMHATPPVVFFLRSQSTLYATASRPVLKRVHGWVRHVREHQLYVYVDDDEIYIQYDPSTFLRFFAPV
jgi:hypothetical protein